MFTKFFLLSFIVFLSACQPKGEDKKTLWIYVSIYKDTIADITPRLQKKFPGVTFKWYQAGSEDIATKVNGEIMAGKIQADLLISSDRFWYEELASKNYLHQYAIKKGKDVPDALKHPSNAYSTVSIPVMALCYNSDAVPNPPASFKEMSDAKWKGKFTTGSPLSSGTNFTTMAMLQHHYGWDYFKKLKENQTIAQGGNSSVLRRIQSKERPVGWVLLENILRFQDKDKRLKIVYPSDGVVIHTNILAITKKKGKRKLAEKVAEWFYSNEGQAAMVRSYMYSPLANMQAPKGAPPFSHLFKNSFKWDRGLIEKMTKERTMLKEKYTEIMFQ